MTLQNTNQTFIAEISISEYTTPVRNHIRRLSRIIETLQVESILRVENKSLLEWQEKVERQSVKRLVFEGESYCNHTRSEEYAT